MPPNLETLIAEIQQTIGGTIATQGEKFHLVADYGTIDFQLVAEGHRKLALIAVLLRNGQLSPGSTLYWDEPEANLNPERMSQVAHILHTLGSQRIQVFIATHSYALLKELSLHGGTSAPLRFFSFYFNDGKRNDVRVNAADTYLEISPNPIDDEYRRLYDLELERSLKGR